MCLRSTDRDVLINTFESICGQEVSAQMDNLQEVPVSVIEVWMQNFRQGRSYYMSDLEQERGQPSYEMLKGAAGVAPAGRAVDERRSRGGLSGCGQPPRALR